MNPVRWLAIRIGRQPWLHKYAKVIVGTDVLIQRLTRGRFNLLTIAGLPEVTLTVSGRKSGEPRTTPLLCVPTTAAGWSPAPTGAARRCRAGSHNLGRRRHRPASCSRGRTSTVAPRRVAGAERAEKWHVMLQTWPNYAKYAERTDREIPVFFLDPR